MADEYYGLLAQIRNEGKKEGKKEGKREGKKEIIELLLKNLPIDEVCEILKMEKGEIEHIIKN